MSIKLVFYAVNALAVASAMSAYHFNGYLYENDWSHLCEKRSIPSIFLPRNVAEASSQVVHFAQIDLPYSCSLSVRTEPGTAIILVIQVSSEHDLKDACSKHNSQMLVYKAGETFGGYWGNIWKEDIAYTTDHENYYGIKQPEEKQISTTTTEITTERTDRVTSTISTTTKMDAMEVILPIVNISLELNDTDEEFTEPYKLPEHEYYIHELKLKPGQELETITVPIATFALNYPNMRTIDTPKSSTMTSPASSKKRLPAYHDRETTPLDIDNYTIDIFKPRPLASVTGRKYHLSVTSRRPYYQKKIVTSSLEKHIFRTKDCGVSCRSTTMKSKQLQEEEMKKYLRNYFSTMYTFRDENNHTQVAIEAVVESQSLNRETEVTNSLHIINKKLKKISDMFVDPDLEGSTKSYYIKGNDSYFNVMYKSLSGESFINTSTDTFSSISSESPSTSSRRIKNYKYFTGGNDTRPSTSVYSLKKHLKYLTKPKKWKKTKWRLNVPSTVHRNEYYFSGNESMRHDRIKPIEMHSLNISLLPPNTSEVVEEHKQMYTSGWDHFNSNLDPDDSDNLSENTTTDGKLSSVMVKKLTGSGDNHTSSTTRSTKSVKLVTSNKITKQMTQSNLNNEVTKSKTDITTKSITFGPVSKITRLHITRTPIRNNGYYNDSERPYLHYIPLSSTASLNQIIDADDAWMKGLNESLARRMVNHKSWENVVKAVPEIAVALKVTNNYKNNNSDFRSQNKSANNRKKRYLSLIALHRRKSYTSVTQNIVDVDTVAHETRIADANRFAEFIELENPYLQYKANLSDYTQYTDNTDHNFFNICHFRTPKVRQVVLLNRTSRIVIAFNNFTINRMSIVLTSAAVLRSQKGSCPERTLECQVAGTRVCIDSVHACDGIPNCAANDIYDEDRITCGKLKVNAEYDVYIAAITLLVLLLTFLYAVHYWLNRCIPQVSEAFFVYRDGIENKLCLSTIMRPPGESDDNIMITSYEDYADDEVIYQNIEREQTLPFKGISCLKIIKKLFRRKEKVSIEVSVDLFQEEDNEMYSFAMSEIDKIVKETKNSETQTGASLEFDNKPDRKSISITSEPVNSDHHFVLSNEPSRDHLALDQWSASVTSDLSLLRFMRKITEQKRQQQSRKSFAVSQMGSTKTEQEVSNYVYASPKLSYNEPSTSTTSESVQRQTLPKKQIRFEEKPSVDIMPKDSRKKPNIATGAGRKSHDAADDIDEEDETGAFRRFWTGMKMLPKKKPPPKK